MPEQLPKRHTAGNCHCGVLHSVPGAMSLNQIEADLNDNKCPHGYEKWHSDCEVCSGRASMKASESGNYTAIIRRDEGGPDPLVQEPNK